MANLDPGEDAQLFGKIIDYYEQRGLGNKTARFLALSAVGSEATTLIAVHYHAKGRAEALAEARAKLEFVTEDVRADVNRHAASYTYLGVVGMFATKAKNALATLDEEASDG